MPENIFFIEYFSSISTYNKTVMIHKYIWIHYLSLSRILIAYFSLLLIESKLIKQLDCMQSFDLKKCSVQSHILYWIFHIFHNFFHLQKKSDETNLAEKALSSSCSIVKYKTISICLPQSSFLSQIINITLIRPTLHLNASLCHYA